MYATLPDIYFTLTRCHLPLRVPPAGVYRAIVTTRMREKQRLAQSEKKKKKNASADR